MSARTSPVLRGKWVMEVLMGTPPPPPPPNVPAFDDEPRALREADVSRPASGWRCTGRTRRVIRAIASWIPIGLALDGFDVTGRVRIRENMVPLDTRGTFYDGTDVSAPDELVEALLKRPIPLVRNFTANLLAYATGRRMEYFDQPDGSGHRARQPKQTIPACLRFILGVVKSAPFQMGQSAKTDEEE